MEMVLVPFVYFLLYLKVHFYFEEKNKLRFSVTNICRVFFLQKCLPIYAAVFTVICHNYINVWSKTSVQVHKFAPFTM